MLKSTIKEIYDKSLIGRGNEFFKKSYENSLSKDLWVKFGQAKNPVEGSIYAKFAAGLARILKPVGKSLENSVFHKMLLAIGRGYSKITKGSIVFKYINMLNLRQWGLLAFAMYLPIDVVLRTKVGVAVISSLWEEAFIAAAIIFIAYRKLTGESRAIGRETSLEAYIILFMAIGLFLMTTAPDHPEVALAGYRAVVTYIIWFFLIIRLIEDEKDFKVLFYGIMAVGIFMGLHGVYQFIVKVPIPASWVTSTEMGVRTRVFSITGSPNILGTFMVMTAPLAAAMIYHSKKLISKLIFLALTGAMCLCLLFTFSRGAWVGIVVAVSIFAIFVDKRLFGLMGAAMAGVLVFVPSITSRLTFLFTSEYAEASAVGGRSLRWETGRLLLLERNPWIGFGLGRFGGAVAMNNKILEETEEFKYFYMDNYYLKTMVEMGYIGIIFYLLMLGALLVWGFRAVYNSGTYKAPAAGILAGLCGVLVHCYFENIFEETYMMAYFWGLAAVLIYLGFFRDPRRLRDSS